MSEINLQSIQFPGLDDTYVIPSFEGVVADAYSSSSTYSVGDYVLYDSVLYRCTTAVTTAGTFESDYWTVVTAGDELDILAASIGYVLIPYEPTFTWSANGSSKATDVSTSDNTVSFTFVSDTNAGVYSNSVISANVTYSYRAHIETSDTSSTISVAYRDVSSNGAVSFTGGSCDIEVEGMSYTADTAFIFYFTGQSADTTATIELEMYYGSTLESVSEKIDNAISEITPYTVDASEVIVNRDLQNNNTISFAWASDLHHQIHDSALYGAALSVVKEMADVAEAVKVDFVTITGDIVNGYYPVAEQKENLVDVVNTIRGACSAPAFLVEGNHDDNSWYASANGSSGTAYTGLDEVLVNDQFTNYSMNNSIEGIVFDESDPLGGYYYKDFSKSKTRVIVLNTTDIPYIENSDLSLDYYGQWTFGFQEAQLEWLANEALQFSDSGWGVVLMMHYDANFSDASTTVNNISNLNAIINAFISNESGTTTSTATDFELSVTYDFTSNSSNTVLAWFSGHFHSDGYELIDGIPHVRIINAFNAAGGGYDIVTLDRSESVIYTKRYNDGALTDYDRTISF